MALELNGTTGVSLVQDGVVTAADLSSTLDLTGKTVTLPAGTGGQILQVVHDDARTQATGATESYGDTGLSATITPSSTSSRILIAFSQPMYHQRQTNQPVILFFRILRGASTIVYENDRASGLNAGTASNGYIEMYNPINSITVDSPSTTAATTYKVQYRVLSSSNNGAATAQPNNQWGLMTLMEIAE